jgi:RsiW-degrading membrane proteinase PrsW (M82 family)
VYELLILAVAPAIFLLIYFYLMDRYEPEPLKWVLKVFLYGAVMTVPALLIEAQFAPGLLLLIVVAPVVEELLKFAAVYFSVYRDQEFDEPMDGIVYAASAALGFATIENIIFVIMSGELMTSLFRALISVPGHALFSVIWGYSLGIAKFRQPRERPFIIGAGLAGAIIFHSFFNLILASFQALDFVLLIILLVSFGWLFTHWNIHKAHEHPQSMKYRQVEVAETEEVGQEPIDGNQQSSKKDEMQSEDE